MKIRGVPRFMPKDTTIETILVIGSGPIVIGQAAEFDYAGTQACIALKEEGYKVILVNNNPATIMTDSNFADRIYFEPLTVDVVEKIIQKENPDGILATLGGQTGLNLAFQLNEQGILQKYGVKMLGSSIDSIKRGEDREAFRQLMKDLNEPVPESEIVHTVEEALAFAKKIDFPIIVRPAYTLGGTGGGIAADEEELIQLVSGGLQESAIHQCLVERSIAGFKEVEYEVMRDAANTCITICNMENFDPVGVHTGDSIVVAPSQTLTDDEYQMLRSASIKIISALGIIGGCNIQFALDPKSKNYYLIEVNPRVSRSSALASKATGYPIARMAAKLAVGYRLDEIINPVTGDTFASFEPALDYVVVKIPKWPFDKFPSIERKLGTQMKATGEVMGIDRSFERALLKAVHSLEIEVNDLQLPGLAAYTVEQLIKKLLEQNDERLFILLELIRRGSEIEELHQITKIDLFFLSYLKRLVALETSIAATNLAQVSKEELLLYKEKGFSDSYLARTWNTTEKEVRNKRKNLAVVPAYKMVDTCAAEFEAKSNYYYSTYFGENEQVPSEKEKVLIIGSGPIRIGQGIEFDYCSVHGVFALKEQGIETIMINNNPETVSTDFATADKLYFEPLVIEDILNVVDAEEVTDVIIQLGGQTAINLAKQLEEYEVNILGTKSDTIDILEDRKLFYQLLEQLEIPHLQGDIVNNTNELHQAVAKIGYPVLLRPSFVIGGRGMEIIHNEKELEGYIQKGQARFPFLVDEFLHATEAELDLVTDGQYILAPAIMEHIEKTGVHSGDSMSVLPAQNLSDVVQTKMLAYAKSISQYLKYKGLMNIQFIISYDEVYVLEVNPRASRTAPIVSKVTGVPLVQIATKILLGKYNLSKIDEERNAMGIPFVCVKYPVFSNYALKGLDSKVSAEMRSTGEGICLGATIEEALRKSFHQAIKPSGRIVVKENIDEVPLNSNYEAVHCEDETLLTEQTIAYYNPNQKDEDRRLREYATKKRIMNFTEAESLMAFYKGLNVKDFEVKAIEEWYQLMAVQA
jgi:carbamoyl-phosphate synthase large subunit